MKKVLLALTFVALISARANAVDKYWDRDDNNDGAAVGTTASGAWDTVTANWNLNSDGSGANTTWAANDAAFFSAGTDATGTSVISGNATASRLTIQEGTVEFTGTITMGANPITVESGATLVTNSSLRISTSAGSVYTLNGGTLRTTNPGAAGSFIDVDSTISLNGGGTLDFQVLNTLNIVQGTTVISGTGPLTKTGGGVLAIASVSTYSGDTIVNGGELRMRTGTNRLPTATNLIVNSPGIFNINGSAQNQTVASLSGDGTVGLANGTLTISGTTGTTFSGVITDTANAGASGATSVGGNVTKNLASQLVLTGANTFTGTLTIGNTAGNSVSIGNGGTTGSITSNVATTTNGGLIFNRSNDFSYDKLVSGAGRVTKEGAGILTINGNDWTNTGGVIINGGEIKFGNAAAGFATTAPITINDGAALDMNDINDTFGSLVSTAGNTTGELKMGTANLTLGQTATTGRVYSGTITGSGTLTKGGGTYVQTLSGDNSTYSGNIVVNLGRLAVGHNDALGDTTGNTTIADGAELLFQGGVNITTAEPISVTGLGGTDNGAIAVIGSSTVDLAGPVTLAGDTQVTAGGGSSVTYSNANAITGTNTNLTVQGGGNTTISGVLSLGTGGLTKLQSGILTLNGANVYSGGTTVSSGTLLVNNTTGSGTGSGDVLVNGGTLGGTGTIAGNVTVTSGSLAPGASINEISFGGNLTMTGGSFDYEINSTTVTADLNNVSGNLALSGTVALSAADLGSALLAMGTKFTLINYGGTWDGGTFTGLPNYSTNVVIGSNRFAIRYDDTTGGSNFGGGSVGGGSSFVTITAVPEASTFLVLGLGGIFAIAVVRMGKRMGFNVLNV